MFLRHLGDWARNILRPPPGAGLTGFAQAHAPLVVAVAASELSTSQGGVWATKCAVTSTGLAVKSAYLIALSEYAAVGVSTLQMLTTPRPSSSG